MIKFTIEQRKFLEWIRDNKMGVLTRGQDMQVWNGLEEGGYSQTGKRRIGYNKIRLRFLDEYLKSIKR